MKDQKRGRDEEEERNDMGKEREIKAPKVVWATQNTKEDQKAWTTRKAWICFLFEKKNAWNHPARQLRTEFLFKNSHDRRHMNQEHVVLGQNQLGTSHWQRINTFSKIIIIMSCAAMHFRARIAYFWLWQRRRNPEILFWGSNDKYRCRYVLSWGYVCQSSLLLQPPASWRGWTVALLSTKKSWYVEVVSCSLQDIWGPSSSPLVVRRARGLAAHLKKQQIQEHIQQQFYVNTANQCSNLFASVLVFDDEKSMSA